MNIQVPSFSGKGWFTTATILRHSAVLLLCFALMGSGIQLTAQSIKWEVVSSPSPDEGNPVLQMGVSSNGTLLAALQFGGVRASTDNGQSWQSLSLPNSAESAYVLDIITIGNTLYLCTTSGLWFSTDEGGTWTSPSGFSVGATVYSFWKTSANVLLAGTSSQGMLRSTDGGKKWTTVLPGSTVYAIIEIADNGLFASVDYPVGLGSEDMINDSSGVYRSADGGATWEKTILQGKLIPTLIGLSNGVLVAGTQEVGGTGRVYRSADGGATWNTTPLQDIVSSFIPLPNGFVIASAFNSGIYLSENSGQTWTANNSGLFDFRIVGVVQHSSGYLFAHDVFGKVYRSTKAVTTVSTAPVKAIPIVRLSASSSGEGRVLFTLYEQQHLRFTVYDVLGCDAHILVDEVLPAGEHLRHFSTGNLAAGVYLYRVETSALPVTGMFILGR